MSSEQLPFLHNLPRILCDVFGAVCWPNDTAGDDGVTGLDFSPWAAISLLASLLTPFLNSHV